MDLGTVTVRWLYASAVIGYWAFWTCDLFYAPAVISKYLDAFNVLCYLPVPIIAYYDAQNDYTAYLATLTILLLTTIWFVCIVPQAKASLKKAGNALFTAKVSEAVLALAKDPDFLSALGDSLNAGKVPEDIKIVSGLLAHRSLSSRSPSPATYTPTLDDSLGNSSEVIILKHGSSRYPCFTPVPAVRENHVFQDVREYDEVLRTNKADIAHPSANDSSVKTEHLPNITVESSGRHFTGMAEATASPHPDFGGQELGDKRLFSGLLSQISQDEDEQLSFAYEDTRETGELLGFLPEYVELGMSISLDFVDRGLRSEGRHQNTFSESKTHVVDDEDVDIPRRTIGVTTEWDEDAANGVQSQIAMERQKLLSPCASLLESSSVSCGNDLNDEWAVILPSSKDASLDKESSGSVAENEVPSFGVPFLEDLDEPSLAFSALWSYQNQQSLLVEDLLPVDTSLLADIQLGASGVQGNGFIPLRPEMVDACRVSPSKVPQNTMANSPPVEDSMELPDVCSFSSSSLRPQSLVVEDSSENHMGFIGEAHLEISAQENDLAPIRAEEAVDVPYLSGLDENVHISEDSLVKPTPKLADLPLTPSISSRSLGLESYLAERLPDHMNVLAEIRLEPSAVGENDFAPLRAQAMDAPRLSPLGDPLTAVESSLVESAQELRHPWLTASISSRSLDHQSLLVEDRLDSNMSFIADAQLETSAVSENDFAPLNANEIVDTPSLFTLDKAIPIFEESLVETSQKLNDASLTPSTSTHSLDFQSFLIEERLPSDMSLLGDVQLETSAVRETDFAPLHAEGPIIVPCLPALDFLSYTTKSNEEVESAQRIDLCPLSPDPASSPISIKDTALGDSDFSISSPLLSPGAPRILTIDEASQPPTIKSQSLTEVNREVNRILDADFNSSSCRPDISEPNDQGLAPSISSKSLNLQRFLGEDPLDNMSFIADAQLETSAVRETDFAPLHAEETIHDPRLSSLDRDSFALEGSLVEPDQELGDLSLAVSISSRSLKIQSFLVEDWLDSNMSFIADAQLDISSVSETDFAPIRTEEAVNGTAESSKTDKALLTLEGPSVASSISSRSLDLPNFWLEDQSRGSMSFIVDVQLEASEVFENDFAPLGSEEAVDCPLLSGLDKALPKLEGTCVESAPKSCESFIGPSISSRSLDLHSLLVEDQLDSNMSFIADAQLDTSAVRENDFAPLRAEETIHDSRLSSLDGPLTAVESSLVGHAQQLGRPSLAASISSCSLGNQSLLVADRLDSDMSFIADAKLETSAVSEKDFAPLNANEIVDALSLFKLDKAVPVFEESLVEPSQKLNDASLTPSTSTHSLDFQSFLIEERLPSDMSLLGDVQLETSAVRETDFAPLHAEGPITVPCLPALDFLSYMMEPSREVEPEKIVDSSILPMDRASLATNIKDAMLGDGDSSIPSLSLLRGAPRILPINETSHSPISNPQSFATKSDKEISCILDVDQPCWSDTSEPDDQDLAPLNC